MALQSCHGEFEERQTANATMRIAIGQTSLIANSLGHKGEVDV